MSDGGGRRDEGLLNPSRFMEIYIVIITKVPYWQSSPNVSAKKEGNNPIKTFNPQIKQQVQIFLAIFQIFWLLASFAGAFEELFSVGHDIPDKRSWRGTKNA